MGWLDSIAAKVFRHPIQRLRYDRRHTMEL
jgi:hypothetical protein